VLEESNIVADVVVGASIGALFGAAYAAGWNADRISRLTDVAPTRAVAEFYLNRLRIDRSTYIGSLMLQLGTDTQIEDLPRSFACMALDLSTGRVVPLRSGPLLRSVEASIALPGIARPVSIGSSTYIDGGLRGPIPAAQARTMGAQFVIRVELIGGHPLRSTARRRYRSAFMGALTGRHRLPTASDDLNLAAGHSDGADAMEAPADLTIAPEFYGLFCNSPLGVRFCVRQGVIAAGRAIGSIAHRPGTDVSAPVASDIVGA
jgi:predicted acylesterase/phospholipase RssA